MNLFKLSFVRILAVAAITLYSGWSASAPALSKQSHNELAAVVKLFAESYVLGTGEGRFVTRIDAIDPANAVAIVGAVSHLGRDPDAYTVYVKQIKGKWKVVKFEYIFLQTGKKESRDVSPPFPYPNWQKGAP